MAYKGCMDDVRAAVGLKQPKQVPIFANSEEFDVKWHGKYPYEELCQSGDKMAEVWIAAVEEFDYDWAWLQIDDCFEFEPLGVGTKGEGDILRATSAYLPAARETLDTLTNAASCLSSNKGMNERQPLSTPPKLVRKTLSNNSISTS